MARSVELGLISSILRDKDLKTAAKAGLTPEMFKAMADEWTWLDRYWTRYRKTPSMLTFKNSFPTIRILDVNDTDHYVTEVKRAYARQLMLGYVDDMTDYMANDDLTK